MRLKKTIVYIYICYIHGLFNFKSASENPPAIQVELEASTTSKRMVFLLGNWAGLPNLGKLWQAKGYSAVATGFLYKNHGQKCIVHVHGNACAEKVSCPLLCFSNGTHLYAGKARKGQ